MEADCKDILSTDESSTDMTDINQLFASLSDYITCQNNSIQDQSKMNDLKLSTEHVVLDNDDSKMKFG
jgi:hypothetical protein